MAMNRSLNVANCWKICHLRFICCRFAQGLQGHHFPTGRVAGRGTGSHRGREATGCPKGATAGPRQVERQRAGRQAEELRRLKMEKERVERAPLGNRFKTSWFLDIFWGTTVVEVKEWDVEWFWDVGMYIVLTCFTDMQILYIYIYIHYNALRIDEDPFSWHGLHLWSHFAEEKRIENWSKRCASGAQTLALKASLELSVNHPGANARLERQARIEKELMQQNTQVRASCIDGSHMCLFESFIWKRHIMWQAQLLVDNMEEALLKARQKLRFPEHLRTDTLPIHYSDPILRGKLTVSWPSSMAQVPELRPPIAQGARKNNMQGKLEKDVWILMDFGAENSGLNFIPMNSFRHAYTSYCFNVSSLLVADCKIPIPKDSIMTFGMNPNI